MHGESVLSYCCLLFVRLEKRAKHSKSLQLVLTLSVAGQFFCQLECRPFPLGTEKKIKSLKFTQNNDQRLINAVIHVLIAGILFCLPFRRVFLQAATRAPSVFSVI